MNKNDIKTTTRVLGDVAQKLDEYADALSKDEVMLGIVASAILGPQAVIAHGGGLEGLCNSIVTECNKKSSILRDALVIIESDSFDMQPSKAKQATKKIKVKTPSSFGVEDDIDDGNVISEINMLKSRTAFSHRLKLLIIKVIEKEGRPMTTKEILRSLRKFGLSKIDRSDVSKACSSMGNEGSLFQYPLDEVAKRRKDRSRHMYGFQGMRGEHDIDIENHINDDDVIESALLERVYNLLCNEAVPLTVPEIAKRISSDGRVSQTLINTCSSIVSRLTKNKTIQSFKEFFPEDTRFRYGFDEIKEQTKSFPIVLQEKRIRKPLKGFSKWVKLYLNFNLNSEIIAADVLSFVKKEYKNITITDVSHVLNKLGRNSKESGVVRTYKGSVAHYAPTKILPIPNTEWAKEQ